MNVSSYELGKNRRVEHLSEHACWRNCARSDLVHYVPAGTKGVLRALCFKRITLRVLKVLSDCVVIFWLISFLCSTHADKVVHFWLFLGKAADWIRQTHLIQFLKEITLSSPRNPQWEVCKTNSDLKCIKMLINCCRHGHCKVCTYTAGSTAHQALWSS